MSISVDPHAPASSQPPVPDPATGPTHQPPQSHALPLQGLCAPEKVFYGFTVCRPTAQSHTDKGRPVSSQKRELPLKMETSSTSLAGALMSNTQNDPKQPLRVGEVDKDLPQETQAASVHDPSQSLLSTAVDQDQLLPPQMKALLCSASAPDSNCNHRVQPPKPTIVDQDVPSDADAKDQDQLMPKMNRPPCPANTMQPSHSTNINQDQLQMDASSACPSEHQNDPRQPSRTSPITMDQDQLLALRVDRFSVGPAGASDQQPPPLTLPIAASSRLPASTSSVSNDPRQATLDYDPVMDRSFSELGGTSLGSNLLPQGNPSGGDFFFASTMLEGVNKECMATMLNAKLDKLTSRVTVLQEEVRVGKVSKSSGPAQKRKRKVLEGFEADDEGGGDDEDEDEDGDLDFRCTPAWVCLQAAIRAHMISLLKIKNLSPNQLRCLPPPLTDKEVESFDDNGDDAILCTPKDFRIDFSRSCKKFQFNQASRDVFIAHFLKCVKSHFYDKFNLSPEYIVEDRVGIALDAHVDYIRCQYKKLTRLRLIPREVELKAQAQNSRKDTLFDSRIRACLLRPSLRRHLGLLNSLSCLVMSGDETDSMGPPKVFRIINQEWQSKEFCTFMRTLDSIYQAEWANPHGHRCVPGNAP
ncbi:hypothetical protein F4604DRAFT_1936868 [Suillus subluteus]|nr:hypothetical protein F4604DRAFT_1936868 [Suillus subluteus]